MKRKNKNAFTLIELLAVILILAVIALIATPIILGIVEDAKKDAFLRSVELVASTTGIDITNKAYEEEYTYAITDGNISNLEVGIKNTAGMNGSIIYDNEGNDEYAIHNGVYCVIKKQGEKAQIKDYKEGECKIVYPMYTNGQRVYFDVVKGTGCTMEEYASSYDTTVSDFLNSKTDYNGLNGSTSQNSCLLFYAFNDDGGRSINLILDHNAIALTPWTDGTTTINKDGPKSVLNELKNVTDEWKGTVIPKNYTVYQVSGETIYGDYTIAYKTEKYKARLITAQEIAQITGADTKEGVMFDENKSYDSFYFETLLNPYGSSDICTKNCKYNWLYDRTYSGCTQFGCLNNANSEIQIQGYWTATSAFGSSTIAWEVFYGGFLDKSSVGLDCLNGVRPVIEVSKYKITPGEAPVIPQ